jgi:hypothetical protein
MKKTSKLDPQGKLRRCTMKQLKDLVKGCRIIHSKRKKDEHIELLERGLEVNDRRSRFSLEDFFKVVSEDGTPYIADTEKAKDKADRWTLAKGWNWVSRYDSWYIPYTFFAGKYEYAFIWETYYDELHRAYSNESVWYDGLGQGTYFTIRYYNKDPRLHYVDAARYKDLKLASFVGKRKVV